MYSTRRVNKNVVDGNAYIAIGDPYVKDREKLPDRFRGKKLVTLSHPQNQGNGMFAKVTYASEPYSEMERYTKTQPLESRKKGFGSKDASRRGEFTSFIRTEQYRETLHKEMHVVDKFRNKEEEQRVMQKFAEAEAKKPKTFLYDIGRTKVTPFDPKVSRDQHYIVGRKEKKDLGPYRVSSADIGDGAWEWKLKKPEFGPIAYVKMFFDDSHLESPGF